MGESRFKLRISKVLDKRGFGLAETMVTISIIGVLVVAVISQQKVSNKSLSTNASDAVINDVVRMAIGEITDQATCTENFGTKSKNETYTKLINFGTKEAFLEVDKTYGVSGNLVEDNKTVLGEVQVVGIETQEVASGLNPYAMILRIKFKRKIVGGNFSLLNNNTINRDIPINTVLDNDGKISSCFGDFNLLAQSAVRAACLQKTPLAAGVAQASRYEEPTTAFPYGRCLHKPGDLECAPGAFLQKVDKVTNPDGSFDGRPEYTCGSLESSCPIAGQFIVGFDENTNMAICDYPLPKCSGVGEVITRSGSGQYQCVKIDCSGLIPVSAFAGFNANGTIKCNPLTVQTPCPDSFATSVNPDGTFTCSEVKVKAVTCPVGQRVVGIDSNGFPQCDQFIRLPIDCSAGGQALKYVDANGNGICAPIERPLKCGTSNPTHSDIDCMNSGGSPAYVGNASQSQCFFAGTSCPGGWSRCGSWTRQKTNSCVDGSNTSYCDANRATRYAINGDGADVNSAVLVSETCYQWIGAPNNGRACNPVPYTSVTTEITAVGCY